MHPGEDYRSNLLHRREELLDGHVVLAVLRPVHVRDDASVLCRMRSRHRVTRDRRRREEIGGTGKTDWKKFNY